MCLRKQQLMYALFGKEDGHKCRECKHLDAVPGYYKKCRLYGNSASEATDWALSWDACGMLNKDVPESFLPVKDRKKRRFYDAPKPETQCQGQMSLFGEEAEL